LRHFDKNVQSYEVEFTFSNPFHFSGSGFKIASRREEDEDVNLDVDGDDSDVYGKPQYPSSYHQ
jgi:hypothetical protein